MGGDLGRMGRGILTGGLSEMFYEPQRQQKKAQEQALAAQQRAAMEARRIAAEQKPLEEAATLQTNTGGSVLGNLGLAVEADYSKKKPSALGGVSGTSSGLGFGNV